MADDKATAPDADGVKTPVDDVQVDTTSAIDASAKGADPVDPDPAAAAAVADAAAGDAAPSGEEAKRKPQRLPEWAEKKLSDSEFEKRELRRKAKELEEKLAAQSAPNPPAQPNAADEAAAKANAPVGQTPEEFERAVQGIPQVLSCHRISGRYDYQLMALAEDLEAYGSFAEVCINALPSVKEVYTSFVMREVKAPGSVPLPG